ncbi:histidine N-acetyltransferase-like [Stylophora pistillata]|uniref:histidine N-acetyltransferase-like n=1 Tax=Stylophora pistillata TaxID=50429 RepID=UPI000C04E2F1|nr:histidine N-acetyltransferase-like [Stylophora pistillata]
MEDTFDYVPYRFHNWLTEPNRINIVAEKGSKVVGFMGMSVVDCEESVVIEGGRVVPNHRNRRVKNAIKKHKVIDKELHYYDFLTYKVDPEQVNFEHKLENCSSLRPYPKEEFQKNVLKNTGTRSLLPNNILVIDWQPFEAILSNIEHISQDRDQYFVDSPSGCQGQLNPLSFSLGRCVLLVCGMVRSSTIYAKDSKLCRSHVIHQSKSACQTAQGSFYFSTYQDPSLTKYCKEVLHYIPGVTRINDEEPTQTMFIFEGKLEANTIK